MNAMDSSLAAEIRAQIGRDGPMPFRRFMELALYHPVHGYYSSGRCTIGRAGDYFTSVSVGPLFGQMLAAQFAQMWRALDRPERFVILEQGAHDGQFAADVLAELRATDPDFFAAVRYEIVEPFVILRERQAATLALFPGKVRWHDALAEVEPIVGVHFSNELIDAMPIHLVRWRDEEWTERCVENHDDDFAFVDRPIEDHGLSAYLAKLGSSFPENYETEVNLAALAWIEAVAARITMGFVLAADYGHPRAEFFAPHRSSGTLRAYANHRVIPSPLIDPGACDLTAHVEWTSLAERAEASGFSLLGWTDQHHFLTGLLASEMGARFAENHDGKTARALQTLLHPGFLGMRFQFLALGKGLATEANTLSGLRFARDSRAALELA